MTSLIIIPTACMSYDAHKMTKYWKRLLIEEAFIRGRRLFI